MAAARTSLFLVSRPTQKKPHKILTSSTQSPNPEKRLTFFPPSRESVISPIQEKMTSSPSQNISQRYPQRSSFDIRGNFILPFTWMSTSIDLCVCCRRESDRDWSRCPTRNRKRCIQDGSTVKRMDATSPQTRRDNRH